MNIASITSLSGMRSSLQRFDSSAARTARLGMADANVDATGEAVEQMVAKQGFQANARVLQASLDMEKTTYSLLA